MRRPIAGAPVLALLLLTGCADMPRSTIDPAAVTALSPCPSSPNCVSTVDSDDTHAIAPIVIEGDPDAAWQTLKQILTEQRGIEIIASGDYYLRAVATTRVLRFKDDVEFLLDRKSGEIGMRSASRVGYSDLGANRRRMEKIRIRMIEAGAAAS